MHTTFWLENVKGRDHSEDLDIDERIISECILWKFSGKLWTGFIWLKWRALVNTLMNL
jgi:hypothetical protein